MALRLGLLAGLYWPACDAASNVVNIDQAKLNALDARLQLASVPNLNSPVPAQVTDEEFVSRWTNATVVKFDFVCHAMNNFDLASGMLRLSGWWRLYWNDGSLVYDGETELAHAWSQKIPMDAKRLWTPHIVPYYTHDQDIAASFGVELKTQAFVNDIHHLRAHGWNVFWSRPVVLSFHCKGKSDDCEDSADCNSLRNFPFDSHECDLVIGPWAAEGSIHRFFSMKSSEDPLRSEDALLDSEEWSVSYERISNVSQQYESSTHEQVHIRMRLKRYSHYYVVNAVLPMLLVVVLSSLTFWLSIRNGSQERLAFSSTLLLTIMATSLFTADKRPASDTDTWLDKFQGWSIFLTFYPVCQTCAISWLQTHFSHVLEHSKETGGRQAAERLRQDMMNAGPSLRPMHSKVLEETSKPSTMSRGIVWVLLHMPRFDRSRALTPFDIDEALRTVYNASVPIIFGHLLSLIPAEDFPFHRSRLKYSQLVFLVAISSVLAGMTCSVCVTLVGTSMRFGGMMRRRAKEARDRISHATRLVSPEDNSGTSVADWVFVSPKRNAESDSSSSAQPAAPTVSLRSEC